MEMVAAIAVQILFIVEEILCMHGILQMKFAKGWRLAVGCVLLSAAAVCQAMGAFGEYGAVFMPGIKAVLFILVFRGKISHILIKYLFLVFYMGVIVDPVRVPYQLLCQYFGSDWKIGLASVANELIQILLLIIVVILLLRRDRMRKKICQISLKYWIIGLILGFCVSGVWETAHYILKGEPFRVILFYELLCLGFTEFMYLFGIALLYVNDLRQQYQKESRLKGDLLEMEQAYRGSIRKNAEEARKIRHDMKHHLAMVHYFLEKKDYLELEEYLLQIEKRVASIGRRTNSVGNILADAVIENQCSYMPKDMRLICEGKLPQNLQMEEYDLCTIFANLLSNAREACDKLEHHKKVIQIRIRRTEHRIKLEFSNPVEEKIDLNATGHFTTKANKKEHGYGLQSVRDTVKKYGGVFEYEVEDEMITFRVLFRQTSVIE